MVMMQIATLFLFVWTLHSHHNAAQNITCKFYNKQDNLKLKYCRKRARILLEWFLGDGAT